MCTLKKILHAVQNINIYLFLFRFICLDLPHDNCASKSISLASTHTNTTTEICYDYHVYETEIYPNDPVTLQAWLASEDDREDIDAMNCYLWCTSEGQMPEQRPQINQTLIDTLVRNFCSLDTDLSGKINDLTLYRSGAPPTFSQSHWSTAQ